MNKDVAIYFCIPLIGQGAARNWGRVCELLEQTLASILVQPGNIKVLVACNEIPQTRFNKDPRVEFLQVEGPVPADIREMRRDKHAKRARISREISKLGVGYAIPVDADDLVSNRLTGYIMEDDNRIGYFFQTGYTYDAKTGAIKLSKGFHRLCGTCAVLYIDRDDLGAKSKALHVLEGGHPTFVERAWSIGKALTPVPFPAALYVTNTGESVRDRVGITSLAQALRRVKRYLHWQIVKRSGREAAFNALRAEFGLSTGK